MAKKQNTKRVIDKDPKGDRKAVKGKFYQIGDNAISAKSNLRIVTNKEVIEHDTIDTLPEKQKTKFKK